MCCLALAPGAAWAANVLTNPSFEATGTQWLSPWSFSVRSGAAAKISQSTDRSAGSYAARIDVTQSSSSTWLVQLSQARIALTAGQPITVSFAAKASAARRVEVLLQGTASPYTNYVTHQRDLTTGWATYQFTFTPSATVADVSLRFNLAATTGTVWLDDVSVDTAAATGSAALEPVADAHVRADTPSRNYGTSTTLVSDGQPVTVAYMKFDLAGLAGATISRATLRMRVDNPSNGTQSVRTSDNVWWTESGVTYGNRPPLGNAARTFASGSAGTWVTVDVTSTVAARAGSLLTVGIDSTNSDGFGFHSRNAAADRVHLVVEQRSAPPPPPPGNTKGVSMTPFAEFWGSNVEGMRSDFADMVAGGIGWARIDLRWTSAPNPAFDAAVQAAKDRDIQLVAVVFKPWPWSDLGTDTQRATFRTWFAEMVNRHKHYIKHWEIHNEPNLHYEWNIDESTGSDQTQYADGVRRYVTHLRDAYETVKANDPGATVLFGGLSEWTVERYMDVLVTTDAYRYFDVMAFHPYGWSADRVLSRFNSFKAKMAANANYAAKPIWITEFGFNTSWTNKPGYSTSEQQKADSLVQSAKLLYGAGARLPLFAYTLHENSAEPGFGLTAKDPSTLQTTYFPAFYGYRDLVY
jgi:hypothetical protein